MNSQYEYGNTNSKNSRDFSYDDTEGESLEGVCCEVKSCKYHAPGGICQAQNISVEAPDASKKIETYCGTYAPNNQSF